MPKYGPYSREIILARPDGRTKAGRLLHQMRRALFEQLGGEAQVTPAQRILIERCAMLQLRLAAFDQKILDGDFTEHDSRVFLAWNNSLTRTLERLSLDARVARKDRLELARYLAEGRRSAIPVLRG